MKPFDFVITFLSFVYSMGLAHLLFGAARMPRHRNQITFSWPHALWMLCTVALLTVNWIGLWDFHLLPQMPLAAIMTGAAFAAALYFVCVLVTPDLDNLDECDLKAFHARQGWTYILAFLIIDLVALAMNLAASQAMGVQNWADSNALVLAMVPPLVAALIWRRQPVVQLAAPIFVLACTVAYGVIYYPILK
jgi:hypothetical protein